MNIFDINNPRHKQILKEEIARAKRLIEQSYNADAIWKSMTPDQRKEALYIAKELDPDALLDASWDDLPDDVQDLIDLSSYELARNNQGGGSMLRGIAFAMKENPVGQPFVKKFLEKVGRAELRDLTVDQSYKLNIALWQYIASTKPAPAPRPASTPNPDFDPYDRENPSRGYMGAVYRGD
jgi:hypothetical protein